MGKFSKCGGCYITHLPETHETLVVEYDEHLKRYTIFFEGDDLVFDIWQEAEKFIKDNQ